jgi:hypothetical protein
MVLAAEFVLSRCWKNWGGGRKRIPSWIQMKAQSKEFVGPLQQ